MSLPHRRTTSAVALEELKRRNDLESLRRYLIIEGCFPASKDPETAPITLEELKKLVRIWKLNERRNFWKTHSERDEIVSALIQHAEQNMNFGGKKNLVVNKDQLNGVAPSAPLRPVPPNDSKPSNVQVVTNIRNFCGLKYFNREVTTRELTMRGRFYNFPDVKDRVDVVIDQWRSEDFDMKDEVFGSPLGGNGNNAGSGHSGSMHYNPSNSIRTATVSGIKNKVKIVKQRNLAMHLMNYSAHIDLKKTNFTMKMVQTFVTVAESDDPKTVSKCMIALSNISSDSTVRNILLEMNTMHKLTNMLQYLRGKAAYWAAGLLFYYFSCDKESEDRVYNACSMFLQVNGNSKDSQVRLVTLYTLNNLMPCIDRQRIAELIMRTLITQFDPSIVFHDKNLTNTYLTIMQNMSWFTNAHVTLLSMNILELLDKFARFSVNQHNGEMGLAVAKILQSFLQLPEQAANVIGVEYMSVLSTLLESDDERALVQALKAAVVLSNVAHLRRLAHTTNLTKTISNMIVTRATLSNSLAREASKYFCNITFLTPTTANLASTVPSTSVHYHQPPNHLNNSSPGSGFHPTDEKVYAATMERLLEVDIHEAVFAILKSSQASLNSKSAAIRALQNIVSYPSNAFKLVNSCLNPMAQFLREKADLGAAYVLYNLACVPLCRSELVESKIHVKVLEFMTQVSEPPLKSAFLQILVQLSGSNVCIVELLKMDLIPKLETQLKFVTGKNDVWRDISLMLLAVVAYMAHDLSVSDQVSITHILRQICVPGVEDDIIENCANVLKFISTRHTRFSDLDPVIRAILDLGDTEEIVDNISNILYNMTCATDNLPLMLKDSYYINVMIRIMRNGKVSVQENVAHAIRTLCSLDKCAELLLKYDIISDLIVIALLRTSSEEIKIVCSQAFYNMLCHAKSRLDLLKGDLWWALMRLGRTDSQTVRSMCIRALTDLSYPLDPSYFIPAASSKLSTQEQEVLKLHKSCIQALRSHHVLSFMKDLSLASHPDSLLSCLQVVHNLLKQFALFEETSTSAVPAAVNSSMNFRSPPSQIVETPQSSSSTHPYAVHEIISSIRIAADAINRSKDIKCIRIATIVLLKCSQLVFTTSAPTASSAGSGPITTIENNPNNSLVDNEFINIDIVEILRLSIDNWKFHSECRLNISRLLFELSKRKFFTKLVPLNDLNSILLHVYSLQNQKENTLEMLENILSMLLQFIVSESVKPIEIIQLTVWPLLLKDALSCRSSLPGMNVASAALSLNALRGGAGGAGGGLLNSPLLRGPGGASPIPSANNSGTNSHRSSMVAEVNPSTSPSPNRGRLSVYQREATVTNLETLDILRGVIPLPFRIQGIALILFSYCIEDMLEMLQRHYKKNDGKLTMNSGNAHSSPLQIPSDQSIKDGNLKPPSSEGGHREVVNSELESRNDIGSKRKKKNLVKDNTDEKTIVENLLTIDFPSVLQGIIRNDFIDFLFTRNNLMHIIHLISQFRTPVIEAIFIPDTFQLMLRLLNNSVGSSRYEKVQEYCSGLLRNIAVNHNYILAFIQMPHFQVVNELLSELCDQAVTRINLAFDLSVFFYFLSDYLQTPHSQSNREQFQREEAKILSPKFVLDMINKLLSHQPPSSSRGGSNLRSASISPSFGSMDEQEQQEFDVNRYYEMININKYTVSIILNKYSFADGVEPQFIQSMYSYLQTNSLVVIPNLMKDVSFKRLLDVKNLVYPEYLLIKEMMASELLLFYKEGDSNYFTPIVVNHIQENDHIILKLTNSKPMIFDRLESMDALSVVVFQKIVVSYEAITEQQYDVQNNMISEENDEEDDKLPESTPQSLPVDSSHLSEQKKADPPTATIEEVDDEVDSDTDEQNTSYSASTSLSTQRKERNPSPVMVDSVKKAEEAINIIHEENEEVEETEVRGKNDDQRENVDTIARSPAPKSIPIEKSEEDYYSLNSFEN